MEKFVFISYCHLDQEKINLTPLKSKLNVWFDDGIIHGSEWRKEVAQKIIDCEVFLFFTSKDYYQSEHCKAEIDYALDNNKKLLQIKLDNSNPPIGLDMYLNRRQAVDYGKDSNIVSKLPDEELLIPCRKKGDRQEHNNQDFGFLTNLSFSSPSLNKNNVKDWGPERSLIPLQESFPYVAFNSRRTEERFITIRAVGDNAWHKHINLISGQEYEVRIAYRNDGNPNLNPSGAGIADGVVLSASVPDIVMPNKPSSIGAKLVCAVANPITIWDSVTLETNDVPLFLYFVPGSSKIYNNGKTNGKTLATNLFEDGIFLGFNRLDGKIPAGDEWSGHVLFRFRALLPFRKTKVSRVAKTANSEYREEAICVSPGDIVSFKTEFSNEGNIPLADVTMRESIKGPLTLVPSTTKLYDSIGNHQSLSDLIDKNGYNFGKFGPGVSGTLEFDLLVDEDALPGEYMTVCIVYDVGGITQTSFIVKVI